MTAMPFNDLDCVTLLRRIGGQDEYTGEHHDVPAGKVGTIVNVFADGTYEVEFLLTGPKGLFSVVKEVPAEYLGPYKEDSHAG